ncbi:hypothetical protein GCM10007147_44480 [Nocardiopsis kunsanensis]|uniref:Putative 4-hydroxy-4-methyl-2-oxoglutarate aldolase n=1 Tax=Nocardiopsis kunsanensis TaxID=141693 RepID=A0A919CMC3_9ACTN|nr:hypothetical protein GCM10007147_44480 [Nocardiopsis kunsanensis]
MTLAETLSAVGTVALARCGGRPLGAHLFSVWPGAAFAASAFPVRCAPGDNLALHVAVEQAPPGSALVVDVAGEAEYGYVDEILAVAAHTRGIEGIVLDGCVRDIAAIARCAMPVFSSGVSVREAGHHAGGSVGQMITMSAAGPLPLQVRRGDWIAADDDGVVLLPRGQVSSIIGKTVASLSHEQELIDAVHAGQSTLDLLGLDPSQVSGWEGDGEHHSRRGAGARAPRRDGTARGEGHTPLRSCSPPHTSVGERRYGE